MRETGDRVVADSVETSIACFVGTEENHEVSKDRNTWYPGRDSNTGKPESEGTLLTCQPNNIRHS
jgi:hypothetical protein